MAEEKKAPSMEQMRERDQKMNDLVKGSEVKQAGGSIIQVLKFDSFEDLQEYWIYKWPMFNLENKATKVIGTNLLIWQKVK